MKFLLEIIEKHIRDLSWFELIGIKEIVDKEVAKRKRVKKGLLKFAKRTKGVKNGN
ncbi:hypothetical protein LCGC14_3045700 [marine sediment metagenome]|uniref:Uncharacterized protein n=1 Tax=marine sediment metagenome TaxID=412755 RepID=A0A0F8XBG7_9ZZZZ